MTGVGTGSPGEDLVSKGRANRAAQRPSLGTHSPLCLFTLGSSHGSGGPRHTLPSLPELLLLDARRSEPCHVHVQGSPWFLSLDSFIGASTHIDAHPMTRG